ncbi:hypothetical protein TNCV_3068111 [Trichonephila clavipes]|nr:hypothetical protein TNCV_3068111 [Trichonephila clavipes]
MAATIARYTTILLFPLWTSFSSDNTDRLSCSSANCLCFGGHYTAVKWALISIAYNAVDVSNMELFASTIILSFSYLSRKQWIVQAQLSGHLLSIPNEKSICAVLFIVQPVYELI